MFNINKTPGSKAEESKVEEIKENVSQLIDNAQNNVNDIAQEAKDAAIQLSNKALEKSVQTKAEAYNVIESLKILLAKYADAYQADDIKDQIANKAAALKGKAVELKDTVEDEVSQAYQSGKQRTAQTVQEQPLLSLVLVLGAGALVGYILGSKHNSK